ncbi:MAG: CinA family protein [Clostridia bacterium]
MQDINDKFVGKIYSDSDVSLAQCVVDRALEKGVRISLAESITGGMICSSLVDVSGSSKVLVEGLVAYMEESKVRRLHVKLKTLEKYGIVSAPVAKEMVQGLLENSNVTLSLSTTGCAGPSSDQYDTPVGLAFIAIGNKDGITAQEVMFEGSRNYIRNCVKETALYMLLKNINNKR